MPHAGSRSTICHADSHTHGGPRDAATWDKTMRPPVHRPPPGKMPAAGGCGSRARGGKGRPAKFGCPWDRVGRPQLSPGGLARAELVCPELSCTDALLERPPRLAPPGRPEHGPRQRPVWEGAAHNRWAFGEFGLRERPAGGEGTCGRRAPRPRAAGEGSRLGAAGPAPLARATLAWESRLRVGRLGCRGTKARDVRSAPSTALA